MEPVEPIYLTMEDFAFVTKTVGLIEQQRMIETALSENVAQHIKEQYGVDLKSGEWTLDTVAGVLRPAGEPV